MRQDSISPRFYCSSIIKNIIIQDFDVLELNQFNPKINPAKVKQNIITVIRLLAKRFANILDKLFNT